MQWWNGEWHTGWHMGWMMLGWLVGLVLLGVVLWAIFTATRRPTAGPGKSAKEILQRRYATGEIDRETYQRMLADLQE